MKQTRPEFRPATAADYRAFYGKPPDHTMRAHVVTLDDKPVAIGGSIMGGGGIFVFADMKEEFRPYKISIAKFAKKIDEILDGAPGVAIANPEEPRAGKFLEWLGFEHIASTEAGELYKWTKQRHSK